MGIVSATAGGPLQFHSQLLPAGVLPEPMPQRVVLQQCFFACSYIVFVPPGFMLSDLQSVIRPEGWEYGLQG